MPFNIHSLAGPPQAHPSIPGPRPRPAAAAPCRPVPCSPAHVHGLPAVPPTSGLPRLVLAAASSPSSTRKSCHLPLLIEEGEKPTRPPVILNRRPPAGSEPAPPRKRRRAPWAAAEVHTSLYGLPLNTCLPAERNYLCSGARPRRAVDAVTSLRRRDHIARRMRAAWRGRVASRRDRRDRLPTP